MKKWAITRVETDELIMVYSGSFAEAMNFLNRFYEDGAVDVEPYPDWYIRKYGREE